MPRAVLFSALVAAVQGDYYITSSWESWDSMNAQGFQASLGWYGNIDSAEFASSGCRTGDKCLVATEGLPLSGTPQVYVASLTELEEGDTISASFWVKGSGTSTKARIWAHFTEHDHTSYDGSASGNSDYFGLGGVWEEASYTWTVPVNKTGLVIEARIYAYDGGYGDSPSIWVDDLAVTLTSAKGLVATAPAYETGFETPGAVPLGTYTGSNDNIVVDQISEGCYSYPSCFEATEDPLSGTPQVYVASVHNLSPYDHVYAQLWLKGAGGSTKARVWASYFEGEVSEYAGSHPDGGPSDYKGMDGEWGLSSFTWPIGLEKTGLVIQARVYCYDLDYNSVLIDNLLISTNSTTAYVEMADQAPESTSSC